MKATTKYNPLTAGSIDGTDIVPHDRAIARAMSSFYDPPKEASNLSKYALFVARLPQSLSEEELCQKFASIGKLNSCKLIRDIVTGMSKGYGFIDYVSKNDAINAYEDMMGVHFKGKPILVDWKISNTLPGWIPRRLGGGWGGKKESGQLRFGCRTKKWFKPIFIPTTSSKSFKDQQNSLSNPCRKEDRGSSSM